MNVHGCSLAECFGKGWILHEQDSKENKLIGLGGSERGHTWMPG